MALPNKFESIWVGTTPTTDYPELSKEIEVDVVIIGGGIVGVNAAYFLKQQGAKVAIIEANRVATGFSTWRMTTSIFAAKLLTDLILGKENPWRTLYDPARLRN